MKRYIPGLLLCAALLLPALSACDATGYTVTGKPTITARQINTILCAAGSPACGTGVSLYSLGVAYGIDPIYALAWFRKESTFGRYGVARQTLALGNIRCSAGYKCIEGYRAYDSYYAGYQDWYQLIKNLYITQWKLTTVDAIVEKYAPPSENDTWGYISEVEQSVDTWRGQSAIKEAA